MIFGAFCKGRDSSWSCCSQWFKDKIWILMDAWTARLESCLLVPASPWALQNLVRGRLAVFLEGKKKFSGESMIWPLTQKLLQLSPMLHHFFSVGKCFAGEIKFLLLPLPAQPEWPWCCNCYAHAADLQMTCLTTPSNWQLNMGGYDGPQQRWTLQKNSTKSRSGAFICSQILSAFFSFISCASHSPPYSCSCDRVSFPWPLPKDSFSDNCPFP